MNIGDWKYYNHAVVPSVEPHETPDISCIKDRSIWKVEGGGKMPILVRWTTDYDCNNKTVWWYVVKDTPFDIVSLKAKRRYEINKGKKNFEVRKIKPSEYIDDLLRIEILAISSWPEKYRPYIEKESFKKSVLKWDKAIVYGGFDRETNELCGYAYLYEYPHHLEFSMLRVNPDSETKGINAAMVAGILEDHNDRLSKEFYINDGARSIRHETAFQDYLEKYFGFRKAYCKLHIVYRFPINIAVKILYPFRKMIKNNGKLGNLVCSVLKMEEFKRACQ